MMQTITLKSSNAFIETVRSYIDAFPITEKITHIPTDDKTKIMVNTETYALPIRIGTLIDALQKTSMEKENTLHIINFDKATLDTHTFIFTKENGETIPLTEKECEILNHLHINKGAEISRDDLLHSVWNYAQNVETHTLETHIYRLRQKIEDNPSKPKIIKTLEKGYTI